MKDIEFLKELIKRAENTVDGYFQYAHVVAVTLEKRLHDQLNQLVGGPVWDGDVLSKSLRDELIGLGLAMRVCCKGEQGYTGATYFSFSVMKIIGEIKSGKVLP